MSGFRLPANGAQYREKGSILLIWVMPVSQQSQQFRLSSRILYEIIPGEPEP